MRIKSGVSVQGLKSEILLALIVANRIWAEKGQILVITSGTDGKHSPGSRHYIGMAVDLRIRYFDRDTQEDVYNALISEIGMGKEYKIVIHTTHIHIQYNGGS